MEKFVYLVKAGDSHYKVGVAGNVARRIATLQTSNALRVEVVTAKLVADAYVVERSIHQRLGDMRTEGGKEWFYLLPEEAIQIAIQINLSPEPAEKPLNAPRSAVLTPSQQTWSVNVEKKLDELLDGSIDRVMDHWKSETEGDGALMRSALMVFADAGKTSTSLMQRKLKIGYGRASRIMDRLEAEGYVGPLDGMTRDLIRTS